MIESIRIDGIYDKRTLVQLKNMGVKNFGFNFNPRSNNFIQYHVFFDQLLPLIESNDLVFLHFPNPNDPMILKIQSDISNLDNIFFEIENIQSIEKYLFIDDFNLITSYECFNKEKNKGIFLQYEYLKDLREKNLLNIFLSKYHFILNENNFKVVLRNYNLNTIDLQILEYFNRVTVALNINESFEICYRNVNLNLLSKKLSKLNISQSHFYF